MFYKFEYVKLVNNQITLPAEILEKAHLHDGDYLKVNFDNGIVEKDVMRTILATISSSSTFSLCLQNVEK